MPAPVFTQTSLFRVCLALTICFSLFVVPNVSLVTSTSALAQQSSRRTPQPKSGHPEGVLPDLEEVQRESQTEREAPAAIPSTMRSPKVPLNPWNGRRVGDRDAQSGAQQHVARTPRADTSVQRAAGVRRAHARTRVNPPPPVLDDQFIQNFFTWSISRAPSGTELTYWTDQLRVAYAQGQASVKLAAVEFGKTLFESADYAARSRDDEWYVYDLYKTFLMRDPDASGWTLLGEYGAD